MRFLYLVLLIGSCQSHETGGPPLPTLKYKEMTFESKNEKFIQEKLLALDALENDLRSGDYQAVKSAKIIVRSLEAMESSQDTEAAVRHSLLFLIDEPAPRHCEFYLLEYTARRQAERQCLSAKRDADGLRKLVAKALRVSLGTDEDKMYKTYVIELMSTLAPKIRPARFDYESPTFHASSDKALRQYDTFLGE